MRRITLFIVVAVATCLAAWAAYLGTGSRKSLLARRDLAVWLREDVDRPDNRVIGTLSKGEEAPVFGCSNTKSVIYPGVMLSGMRGYIVETGYSFHEHGLMAGAPAGPIQHGCQ